ncbi:MAG: 50S ribosomal protein L11 methyltransferase [Actinomycetota bacterium]|nr:50S ribosomal protein L11 methyltransferase [Actinomycetota bacterium]
MPLERAEEARAEWLERFPQGFEERICGTELELAAYTEEQPPPGALSEDVEPGWEERWREFHRPVRVGRLWIGPPWEQPPVDAVPVVIDPGRAFGTGAHATTRLCIEFVSELAPTSLLDLGCGSGVIAIAAAALGFSPVVALDVDQAAVDATARNAAANGTAVDVRKLELAADTLPSAELAVANISLERVESVLRRVDARMVVASGYLERDEPQVGPYRRRERRIRDGWAADLFERAQ